MLMTAGSKRAGPSFVGERGRPKGSFCRGGKAASRSRWSEVLTDAASQNKQAKYFVRAGSFRICMNWSRYTTQLHGLSVERRS
jgi:hypothetical protein